jgi:hypothetical protein
MQGAGKDFGDTVIVVGFWFGPLVQSQDNMGIGGCAVGNGFEHGVGWLGLDFNHLLLSLGPAWLLRAPSTTSSLERPSQQTFH